MKITYEQIKAFIPCYLDHELEALLPIGSEVEVTEEALLSLPESHCQWLLVRLLNSEQRVQWVQNCVKRARNYIIRAEAINGDAYDDACNYAGQAVYYAREVPISVLAIYSAFQVTILIADAADVAGVRDVERILAVKDALRLLN